MPRVGLPSFRQTGVRVEARRLDRITNLVGELLVLRYLARFGLSFDDVKLVNADASSVPELLKRGEVDVGHSWEPYVSMARNSGCKASRPVMHVLMP